MEFLNKLEDYQKEAETIQMKISSIHRLPVLQFKFKNELENWPSKMKHAFFDSPEIKYVYSASNTKSKAVINKLIDKTSKTFLKDTTTGILNENWLNTIISEQKVGIPWSFKINIFYTEVVFYPPTWDLETVKKTVEYVSTVYYGKPIRSQYIKIDLYDKTFNNEKVRSFLNYEYPIKSFYAAFVPLLTYPVLENHVYKNLLIQFLALKHAMVIGGSVRFSLNYLSLYINDLIVLCSRFFEKVQISKKHVMFGVHGIKFFCDGFKGISDDTYNKILDGILSNEQRDVETIFKAEHKILDIESLRTKLDGKVQELVEYYHDHPEIKDERKLFEEAQAKRTADAISEYFK
jgi:hypothetical protein